MTVTQRTKKACENATDQELREYVAVLRQRVEGERNLMVKGALQARQFIVEEVLEARQRAR